MDLLELQITNKYSLNKAQVAAAMNGNLVALCSFNENDVLPNCLGFGKNSHLMFDLTFSFSENCNFVSKYLLVS